MKFWIMNLHFPVVRGIVRPHALESDRHLTFQHFFTCFWSNLWSDLWMLAIVRCRCSSLFLLVLTVFNCSLPACLDCRNFFHGTSETTIPGILGIAIKWVTPWQICVSSLLVSRSWKCRTRPLESDHQLLVPFSCLIQSLIRSLNTGYCYATAFFLRCSYCFLLFFLLLFDCSFHACLDCRVYGPDGILTTWRDSTGILESTVQCDLLMILSEMTRLL